MKRLVLIGCAAALALTASAEFDAKAKATLRETATQAGTRLRGATALGEKAITLLPVKGDDGGYFEGLLTDAFVGSGRTLVVSNDEKKDARFKRILKEIRWDEAQTTLKSIDPMTIDTLGKLKSTQILVESRVDVSKKKNGRYMVELNLLAYEIETKRFVWSTNLVVGDAAAGGVPSKIRAKLEVAGNGEESHNAAALLAIELKQQLVDLGLVVDGAEKPDVVIKAEVLRTVFDKTGTYLVLDGTVILSAEGRGAEKRLLGRQTLSARGTRGLGELAAEKNLVSGMAAETGKWLKENVSPAALRLKHPEFVEAIAE